MFLQCFTHFLDTTAEENVPEAELYFDSNNGSSSKKRGRRRTISEDNTDDAFAFLRKPDKRLNVRVKVLQRSSMEYKAPAPEEGDASSSAAPPVLRQQNPVEEPAGKRPGRPRKSKTAVAKSQSSVSVACDFSYKTWLTSKHKSEINGVHIGGKTIKCRFCRETFGSENYLMKHINRDHVSKSYVCDTCGNTYANSQCLAKHKTRMHFDKNRLECKDCGRNFTSTFGLMKHITTVHGDSKK